VEALQAPRRVPVARIEQGQPTRPRPLPCSLPSYPSFPSFAAPVIHIDAGNVRKSRILQDGAQTDGHLLLLVVGVHVGLCDLRTMRVRGLGVDVAMNGEGLSRQEGLHLHTKSMVGRR
jgi:hypothetical protein